MEVAVPRKVPRQQRSKVLVESILEAAARVLPDLGVSKATTNRIAELAGVSIGSLYQYFPDKDAILARMIENELEGHETVLLDLARELEREPLARLVGAMIDMSVDRYLATPALTRELFGHAMRLERIRAIFSSRARARDALAAILRAHPEVTRKAAASPMAEMCVHALMGVMQAAVLAGPDAAMGPAALKEELTTMFLAYLRAPAVSNAS